MSDLADSRAAVPDSDIVRWLLDPNFRVGMIERGLAAYRIERLAAALDAERHRSVATGNRADPPTEETA